MQALRCS